MAEPAPRLTNPLSVTDLAVVALEVEIDHGDGIARFVIDLNDGPDGVGGVVTLGRVPALNTITLPAATIARRHLRVLVLAQTVLVADLGSSGGTWLSTGDGAPHRLAAATAVPPFATVFVGHYRLRVGLVPRAR